MSHVTHELIQGTPEWQTHRQKHFNASEIAAVIGISKYQTRTDILKAKATGVDREIDDATQRRFDDGHACEEAAREFAKEIIGEDLFSPTLSRVIDGLPLSASYDGITMCEEITWEHKRINQELAESLAKNIIPDEHKPQLEQQLLICGAKKCLFMASDGSKDNMRYAWYQSDPQLREILLAAWRQFKKDLEAYVPTEEKAPIVARPVTDLPAVMVQVKGSIDIQDNFKAFELALKDFIDNRLIKEPQTDQDFADLEQQVKALKKAEDALESAEAMMLAQVSAIDTVKRQKDMLHELARTNRLLAEKLVKTEKEKRRTQIVQGGVAAFAGHISQVNTTLGGKIVLPAIQVNFATVVKGLKSISSMQNAVDTELARVKIEANRIADQIRLNLASLNELAADYKFLFMDAQQLVMKAPDDMVSLIKVRIAEHKAAKQKEEDETRARIQKEEQEKAEKAAREKLEREAEEKRQADAKAAQDRLDAEAAQKKPEPAQAVESKQPAPAMVSEATVNRVTVQPTITPTAQRTPAPTTPAKQRPSDPEIILALMDRFDATKPEVIGWLMDFQFKAVG